MQECLEIQYMNLLAVGLGMLPCMSDYWHEVCALKDYAKTANAVKNKLDNLWKENITSFLDNAKEYLQIIEKEDDVNQKTVSVIEFCKWLDKKITYSEDDRNGLYFSIYRLIPIAGDEFVSIESLNTNCKETGICINPKYHVVTGYTYDGEKKRLLRSGNRDAFYGLNNELEHCNYVPWDEKRKIINIIISDDLIGENQTNLRIGFCPMTDERDALILADTEIERAGKKFNGVCVEGIKDEAELLKRLINDWKYACEHGVDIFFAPEMLGTKLSEKEYDEYNEMISQLSDENVAEGKHVPILTILPSYWRDGYNSSTIVFQDGRIIGRQYKIIPYVDKKQKKIEALKELDKEIIYLIHITNVHRIAVLICADFLGKNAEYQQNELGRYLEVSLVIVPSYSSGEQDFINLLQGVKCFGTTVVWGNCCGAVLDKEKCIGGCCVMGGNASHTFGEACKCGYSCKDKSACCFTIDLPLGYERKKKGGDNMGDINHYLCS